MSLLDFNESSPKRSSSRKPFKLVLGIGALVATIALGSTLAASINLNSGAPVEFGQGVAQTTACDSEVILTPASTFYNGNSNDYYGYTSTFYFSSLSVSGVSEDCSGVIFKVRAYMNGSDEPLYWPSAPDGTSFEFGFTSNGDWTSPFLENCMDLDNQVTNNPTNNSVKIDWTSCVPNLAEFAGSVDRITIESKDSTTYSVGDRGPGGGIVYYVSANFFTSTGSTCDTQCKYLEVAPATWQSAGASVADDSYYQWSNNTSTATGQDNATVSTEGIAANSAYEKANWQIGKGFSNTEVMKVSEATSEAQAAVLAYAGDSTAGQWFIPSMNELNELCKYARGQTTGDLTVACDSSGTLKTGTADDLGGFVADSYWSSTEYDTSYAWFQGFDNGTQPIDVKYGALYVRPVRAF